MKVDEILEQVESVIIDTGTRMKARKDGPSAEKMQSFSKMINSYSKLLKELRISSAILKEKTIDSDGYKEEYGDGAWYDEMSMSSDK